MAEHGTVRNERFDLNIHQEGIQEDLLEHFLEYKKHGFQDPFLSARLLPYRNCLKESYSYYLRQVDYSASELILPCRFHNGYFRDARQDVCPSRTTIPSISGSRNLALLL